MMSRKKKNLTKLYGNVFIQNFFNFIFYLKVTKKKIYKLVGIKDNIFFFVYLEKLATTVNVLKKRTISITESGLM